MEASELLIADRDYARLSVLARGNVLAEELGRATVVPLARMPGDVVRMHSRVTYRIEGAGDCREVELVFPEQADPASGRISVLAPVGAALLGLREGQSIDWDDFPDGNARRLHVVRALAPLE
ncbi:MAG: nucleoside diphosphate kinase regulator [Proteobacteria bacterium]|jgi:regulator of nucleoside diphosphate kinase|nr:nucleoside diphosphate kinase regulator [Pseudomonadota bacterium]